MRILILGCRGQVGRELMLASWWPGARVKGVSRPEFDITESRSINGALDRYKPDLVVNCSAFTAVDKAEADVVEAFAVNAGGVEMLASSCAHRRVTAIHLSTDYVFDGNSDTPYKESDQIAPKNQYGRSKALGEAALRSGLRNHVILRTSWVYATHGNNFVKTVLRLTQERKVLSIVDDQYGAPTSASDLAAAIVKIADRVREEPDAEKWYGTFHFTGDGWTTWFGFAAEILTNFEKHFGWRPELKRIATGEYPAAAARPRNSRLDCTLGKQTFNLVSRPWQVGLQGVLEAMWSDGNSTET